MITNKPCCESCENGKACDSSTCEGCEGGSCNGSCSTPPPGFVRWNMPDATEVVFRPQPGTRPGCPPGYEPVQVGPAGTWMCRPSKRRMVVLDAPPNLDACRALPWMPDRIRELVTTHLGFGHTDLDRLEATTLAELYPTTRDSQPIPWGSMPLNASPCLVELRRVVRAYIGHLLAAARFAAAEQRYMAVLADDAKRGDQ